MASCQSVLCSPTCIASSISVMTVHGRQLEYQRTPGWVQPSFLERHLKSTIPVIFVSLASRALSRGDTTLPVRPALSADPGRTRKRDALCLECDSPLTPEIAKDAPPADASMNTKASLIGSCGVPYSEVPGEQYQGRRILTCKSRLNAWMGYQQGRNLPKAGKTVVQTLCSGPGRNQTRTSPG